MEPKETMTFHETILEKLLEYRETHSNFNFLTRQRTGAGKRFDSGHWFQGNDKYAFVGLVNASGGINKTRSVGLLLKPKEYGFDCTLQIKFTGEKNDKLISSYKKVISQIGGFVEIDNERFDKNLGKISPNFSELSDFLNENYQSIISIFKNNGCQDVLVSNRKFSELTNNLNNYRFPEKSMKNKSSIEAKVIYAFLKNALSHRKIQKEILDEDAPARGGGFLTMKILHSYDIQKDKKGILTRNSFKKEYLNASGRYAEALILLKKHYPEFNVEITNKIEMDYPLNTILYGPPGTGKTYKLREKYFERFIISQSSLSKEQFILNLVSDLTWWQTFAIALYDLGRSSVNHLLEHEIVKAKTSLSNANNIRPIAWSRMQAHTVPECPNVNVVDRSEPSLFYKETDSEWRVEMEKVENLYPEGVELLEQVKEFKIKEDKAIMNFEFVTFHQSFSYEDFVEGIKPKLEEGNEKLEYEITDGVFKKLCQRAENDLENDYAIFIDEINRGNVSAIFGELITLIEDDKRIGKPQELRTKLPYSKTNFGVPPNLYIIGTMNTADRSVEALDTALRRRFVFKEVLPDPTLLTAIAFDGFNLEDVLTTINDRVETLLDRDHTIGHSYFIKLESGDKEGLKNVFQNNIIPLLQEYFYNDYEKIALVLGEGFIEEKVSKKVQFPKFTNIEVPETSVIYNLISPIGDIQKAIKMLLEVSNE